MTARTCLLVTLFAALPASAGDWPQWRGANRDAKVAGFDAPEAWPKELAKKWSVTVGDGVATPALVGEKLYVFALESGNEVLRCLDATTGKEIWQEKSPSARISGPAQGFQGPRCSPAVSDGKVVTLGVHGPLVCRDAATGKELWHKNDYSETLPRFYTSSSPLIADGVCIVQLGGDRSGAIVAYDLATGKQKWKWTEEGTGYASPELLTAGDTKMVVAETSGNVVGLTAADGKFLWKTPIKGQGRSYYACTPVVDGQTVIASISGGGTRSVKVEKEGDGFTGKEQWAVKDQACQFNTPVIKDGFVYGISDKDVLFCLDEKTGETAWTSPIRGKRGYGSVVDAGKVLFALTPAGDLTVFEPNAKEFKKLASFKVADGDTYAYPVIADKRVFIKDKNSVTLWAIE
jgi:outer membrane protein assembly factor BamB